MMWQKRRKYLFYEIWKWLNKSDLVRLMWYNNDLYVDIPLYLLLKSCQIKKKNDSIVYGALKKEHQFRVRTECPSLFKILLILVSLTTHNPEDF